MTLCLEPEFDSEEALQDLRTRLEEATSTKKGRAKKFENKIHNSHKVVASWKFNEWEYYKNIVPCMARGLFTLDNNIVVRGYDKFFNIDEVPATKEEALKVETKGPYDLTVKENGCIIFVGGLSDGTIIVCSKHSTGARDDLTRNHAVEGESQLHRQLEAMNKSVSELAKLLAKHNITLVLELCDDSFEEHILSYKDKEAGLYLHGINYNLINFKTYPINKVHLFAEAWGFKTVESFQMEDSTKLFEFLNECKKTGTWNNREIEGFVIRCKRADNDFFFKFKFEQPYLIYRHFREVTKAYLREKPLTEIISKFQKEKYIISKYYDFILSYFNDHPEAKERYLEGYGIISLRKAFLESLGLNEISAMNLFEINKQLSEADVNEGTYNKYIVVPIATIGCGKTTISKALTGLFAWGHIQNDNIPSKHRNKLATETLKSLQSQDLVIADRNNHVKRERRDFLSQLYKFKPDYLSSKTNLVVIALNWIPYGYDKDKLFEKTFERIEKRGDNHQSIKHASNPDLTSKIMKGFINRFQELDPLEEPDSNFSSVINLDFSASTFDNVKLILKQLNSEYPDLVSEIPSDETINRAIEAALLYKPEFTKFMPKPKEKKKDARQGGHNTTSTEASKKTQKVVFFGARVADHQGLIAIIDEVAKNNNLWDFMKSSKNVQGEFHVTLGHKNSAKESPEKQKMWSKLNEILKPTERPMKKDHKLCYVDFKCSLKLLRLILCEKVICIQVQIFDFTDKESQKIDIPTLNAHNHITIGTFEDYKPFISNSILSDLIDQYSEELCDKTYELKDGTQVQVINFDDPPVLTYQRLFCHY